jgi:hypothetical protein
MEKKKSSEKLRLQWLRVGMTREWRIAEGFSPWKTSSVSMRIGQPPTMTNRTVNSNYCVLSYWHSRPRTVTEALTVQSCEPLMFKP